MLGDILNKLVLSHVICNHLFCLSIISVALVLIVYWVEYQGWELLLYQIHQNFTAEREFKTLFLLDVTNTERQDLKCTFSEVTRK